MDFSVGGRFCKLVVLAYCIGISVVQYTSIFLYSLLFNIIIFLRILSCCISWHFGYFLCSFALLPCPTWVLVDHLPYWVFDLLWHMIRFFVRVSARVRPMVTSLQEPIHLSMLGLTSATTVNKLNLCSSTTGLWSTIKIALRRTASNAIWRPLWLCGNSDEPIGVVKGRVSVLFWTLHRLAVRSQLEGDCSRSWNIWIVRYTRQYVISFPQRAFAGFDKVDGLLYGIWSTGDHE